MLPNYWALYQSLFVQQTVSCTQSAIEIASENIRHYFLDRVPIIP